MLRRLRIPSANPLDHLRHMTTRGQYNPLHVFETSMDKGLEAKDATEFRRMITNPGPLRFEFSPDYVDWYYRAYLQKKAHRQLKARVVEKSITPSNTNVAMSVGVPLGMSFRPAGSQRRRNGDAIRQKAQETIAECAVRHGMLDAFERLPQVTAIHIDRATNDHVRMIFEEYFAKEAVSHVELWEKALLYRAMLLEKRQSYPDSFKYIFDAVDACVFAQKKKRANAEGVLEGEEVLVDGDKFASLEHYKYFEHLVKKYAIDNAVEAHVVLRCHRLPDSAQILICQPPPLEDPHPVPRPPPPSEFPPLKALLEVEENNYLLRCLIFAEFNTIVTTDPFLKFVAAKEHVSRGDHIEGREKSGASSEIANIISGRRGSLLPQLNPISGQNFDARGRDVLRLSQQSAAAAAELAKELPRIAEENPGHFQSDFASFNPRALRAEIRDDVSRKMLKALRDYERASDSIFRVSYEAVAINNTRVAHRQGNMPPYQPTLAHHYKAVRMDKHVSFALCQSALSARTALERACYDVAKQLFQTGLEYHKQQNRQLHKHKVRIASALLDELVAAVGTSIAEGSCEDAKSIWRGLGTYTPFASRPLDEFGFPTAARFDDYSRWMQRPKGA